MVSELFKGNTLLVKNTVKMLRPVDTTGCRTCRCGVVHWCYHNLSFESVMTNRSSFDTYTLQLAKQTAVQVSGLFSEETSDRGLCAAGMRNRKAASEGTGCVQWKVNQEKASASTFGVIEDAAKC